MVYLSTRLSWKQRAYQQAIKFFLGLICLVILGSPRLDKVHAHSNAGSDLQLILSLNKNEFHVDMLISASAIPDLADIKSEADFPNLNDKKELLEDYIAQICPVKIDGIKVKPILDKLIFQEVDSYLPEEEPGKDIIKNEDDIQTILEDSYQPHVMAELEWSYPIKTDPEQVNLQWGIYVAEESNHQPNWNPDTGTVPGRPEMKVTALFKEYGKIKLIIFKESEPEYTWHRALKPQTNFGDPIPKREEQKVNLNLAPIVLFLWTILILVLLKRKKLHTKPALILLLLAMVGGAIFWNHTSIMVPPFWKKTPTLSEEEAIKTFLALHSNIYRAFDYESEDEIYDVLEQSVDGALLDDLYRDIYQSLILRDEGGAVCKVDGVNIKRHALLPQQEGSSNQGYRIQCAWEVKGFVHHWEHIHQRVNAYKAIYTLMPSESSWKIAAIEVSEHRRLEDGEKDDN